MLLLWRFIVTQKCCDGGSCALASSRIYLAKRFITECCSVKVRTEGRVPPGDSGSPHMNLSFRHGVYGNCSEWDTAVKQAPTAWPRRHREPHGYGCQQLSDILILPLSVHTYVLPSWTPLTLSYECVWAGARGLTVENFGVCVSYSDQSPNETILKHRLLGLWPRPTH